MTSQRCCCFDCWLMIWKTKNHNSVRACVCVCLRLARPSFSAYFRSVWLLFMPLQHVSFDEAKLGIFLRFIRQWATNVWLSTLFSFVAIIHSCSQASQSVSHSFTECQCRVPMKLMCCLCEYMLKFFGKCSLALFVYILMGWHCGHFHSHFTLLLHPFAIHIYMYIYIYTIQIAFHTLFF